MTVSELAGLLRSAYSEAPEKRQATGIHLFAIKYANELESMKFSGTSVSALIKEAGIPNFVAEINKGINLAEYVDVKNDSLWF